MQLPRIELSSTGLAVEPFGNWFKITQVLADENFLYIHHYFRDNFALWKEFLEEIKAGMKIVLESKAEPSDISGQLECQQNIDG